MHIRHRLVAASALTVLVVLMLQRNYEWSTAETTLEAVPFLPAMGCRLDTAVQSCRAAALLMIIFYAGPISTRLAFWGTCIFYEVRRDGCCTQRRSLSTNVASASSAMMVGWDVCSLVAGIRARVVSITQHILGYPANLYIPLRSLVLAPISEEIVFRAAMVVMLYPKLRSECIWIAPLFFAPAHLHHGLQKVTKFYTT